MVESGSERFHIIRPRISYCFLDHFNGRFYFDTILTLTDRIKLAFAFASSTNSDCFDTLQIVLTTVSLRKAT